MPGRVVDPVRVAAQPVGAHQRAVEEVQVVAVMGARYHNAAVRVGACSTSRSTASRTYRQAVATPMPKEAASRVWVSP